MYKLLEKHSMFLVVLPVFLTSQKSLIDHVQLIVNANMNSFKPEQYDC